jgi:hypothetical protein
MTPHVLIVSGLYDFSTDLVALRLQEAGVPFVRLNREHLSDHRLTLDPLVPELTIHGPAGSYQVDTNLRAVWFRQPVFLRNTPPVPLPPGEQLERSQWMAFLRGLCVFSGAAWMNYPAATYLAESKPYQLSIAAACGFQVPTTLASNDASRIRQTFPQSLVIKSLDTVLLHEGDECLFTYTTINPGTDLTDDAVAPAPLFAQRALEHKTDLRVTVIGDDVFAVSILSKGKGIEGDWRIVPNTDLEYRDIALPHETADRCRLLTQRLGLAFAAIDLIETPDGTFFVEANPTGEWGWLSTPTRPIDRAIASWLASPTTRGG